MTTIITTTITTGNGAG
ncbi:thr operon leader peptide [Dryocola sp. BD586]